jgi:excisionase family DNA binding protein
MQLNPVSNPVSNTLSISQMASQLGVHPQTLRRWDRLGQLPAPERTRGNHRRHHLHPTKADALVVGYVRVSSHDQKADLAGQSDFVITQSTRTPDLIISDLGGV